MKYYGRVFRPPSEARSLIVQIAVGCSYNKCDFCSMYKGEDFYVRKFSELREELEEYIEKYPHFKRVFIADGDALCLSNRRLIELISFLKEKIKNLERISSYATAKDILRKSRSELIELRESGLELLYVGYESGSDEILRDVNKNHTRKEYIQATKLAKECGFKIYATVIAGLGGLKKLQKNAKETAILVSRSRPDYLSYLTLELFKDTPLYERYESGEFQILTPLDVLSEIKIFLENVDSEDTIFRSNHASNYIALAGTLNRDKSRMIEEIENALEEEKYIPEWMRGF